MNAARMLADPRSRLAGLSDRYRLGRDGDTGQQYRIRTDPCHDEVAVAAQLQQRVGRPDPTCGRLGACVVAARDQPRGLARRVKAADLHRDSGEAGHAQHEHSYQRHDRERRFDRDGPGIAARQTLVFNARLMMFVSAPTIESPVTTVYRIAPKAAAARCICR
jgi:hypothetical protein